MAHGTPLTKEQRDEVARYEQGIRNEFAKLALDYWNVGYILPVEDIADSIVKRQNGGLYVHLPCGADLDGGDLTEIARVAYCEAVWAETSLRGDSAVMATAVLQAASMLGWIALRPRPRKV